MFSKCMLSVLWFDNNKVIHKKKNQVPKGVSQVSVDYK